MQWLAAFAMLNCSAESLMLMPLRCCRLRPGAIARAGVAPRILFGVAMLILDLLESSSSFHPWRLIARKGNPRL